MTNIITATGYIATDADGIAIWATAETQRHRWPLPPSSPRMAT